MVLQQLFSTNSTSTSLALSKIQKSILQFVTDFPGMPSDVISCVLRGDMKALALTVRTLRRRVKGESSSLYS